MHLDEPQGLLINRLIHERLARNPATRDKFMKVAIGPSWYRGLSLSQKDAANDINDCLRDDMEQRTTYRLVRTLDRLGVHPKPTRKNIQLLMRMSRGNDLAFLWFLMELCYKTEGHGHTYDVNEQIIMSAIFWLDLNPTLRELDRILPLPHDSAANRAKAEVIEKHKQSKEKLNFRLSVNQLEKKKSQSTFRPLAPYFQKPVSRRHWQTSRKLVADYPEQPALLNPVPQETALSSFWSRWFGDHNFSEGHRVATSVLYAEINNIFESMKAVNMTSNKVGSMCANHQRINEMEKSLELELEVMKQEKLKELLVGRNRADQRRRKRVIEELNQMTACFQAQFHVMAAKARKASTRKHLITGTKPDISCMPNLFGQENSSDDENCHKSTLRVSLTDKELTGSDKSKWNSMSKKVNVKLLKGDKPILPDCLDIMPEPMECVNCNIYDPKNGLPDGPAKKSPRPSSLRQFLRLCGGLESEKNSSQTQLPSRSNSHRFFQLGRLGPADYKFNYRELFKESNLSRLDSEQLRLKAAFVEALDNDCQYLNAVLNCEEDGSLDKLVARAAKRIFQKDTEIFHHEYERLMRRKAKKKSITGDRLDFGREFYDCADIKLMKHMLRKGLDKVGENRRYVLPTLPNVESVPYLVEWICYRYGKRYSKAELNHSFAEATLFMESLTLMMKRNLVKAPRPHFRVCNLNDLDSPKSERLANKLKQRYRNNFVESVMEVGRVFYSAMRPQLCGHLALESTFYAYMPAKYHDTGFSIARPYKIRKPPLIKRTRISL